MRRRKEASPPAPSPSSDEVEVARILDEAITNASIPDLLRTAADLWEEDSVRNERTAQLLALYAAKRIGTPA